MYLADALDARANISHFKVWCTIMNICAIQQHCHNLNKDVTAVCCKLQQGLRLLPRRITLDYHFRL